MIYVFLLILLALLGVTLAFALVYAELHDKRPRP